MKLRKLLALKGDVEALLIFNLLICSPSQIRIVAHKAVSENTHLISLAQRIGRSKQLMKISEMEMRPFEKLNEKSCGCLELRSFNVNYRARVIDVSPRYRK